jgi:hypothetical protein
MTNIVKIENIYAWSDERLVSVRFKIDEGYLSIIAVYEPEVEWREFTEEFYNHLQRVVDECNKNDYIVTAGDFNARVDYQPMLSLIG